MYTVPLIYQSFLIRVLNWVNVEMFILGREVIYPNNRTEFLLSQFLEFDVNVFKASLSIERFLSLFRPNAEKLS